jgi:hypothetical protein
VKAYLVTKEPARWAGKVKVVYIPFAEEEVLYVFDGRTGFIEISGRDNITEFIVQMKNET